MGREELIMVEYLSETFSFGAEIWALIKVRYLETQLTVGPKYHGKTVKSSQCTVGKYLFKFHDKDPIATSTDVVLVSLLLTLDRYLPLE